MHDLLPRSVAAPLRTHFERVRDLHAVDLAAGFGRVYLPTALDRKFPNAAAEFRWQYVFPSAKLSLATRARGRPGGITPTRRP